MTRGSCQSRPARVPAIRATGEEPVSRCSCRAPEGVGAGAVRLRPARKEARPGPTPVAVQSVRRARAVSAARAVKEERGQPGPRREHTGAPVTLLPRIPPTSPAAIRRVGSGRGETPAMGSRADHRPSVPRPPSLSAAAARAPATLVATGPLGRPSGSASGPCKEAGVLGSGLARKGPAAVVVGLAPPDPVRHKALLLVASTSVRTLPPARLQLLPPPVVRR